MKCRKQRSILLILLSMILFATLLIAVGCKKDIYYTVSFDVDGGTEVQSKKVLENSKIGELPVTSKTDYEFLGWSDAKGGDVNIDENYIVTKDITLYVVFKDTSEQLCTVTFSSEGTSVVPKTVKKNSVIGELPTSSKEGYEFLGWSDSKNGAINITENYIVTKDITLYAIFKSEAEELCTVTFNVEDKEISTIKIIKNNPIGTLPIPTKEGYTFIGWVELKNSTKYITQDYVITEDITLYAIFEIIKEEYCTVSFETSGTQVDSITVKKGEPIGLLPFTDKQGYSFSGWFFDEKLTVPVYNEDIITINLTLYAGFEKQDVDSVLPEYTELSMSTEDINYEIQFESSEVIDERNINSFISVTALYGKLPRIAVISYGDNKYALSPVGGFSNGAVYKFEITDNSVSFIDLDTVHDEDYTEEKVIKTVYLSIDLTDIETVSMKSDIFEIKRSSVTFNEANNTFIASKAIYDKLPLDKESVIHVIDSIEDSCYIKIKDIKPIGDDYEITYIDCEDIDDIYEDFNLNISNISVANDMTIPENQDSTNAKLDAVVQDLYNSKGTEALTAMLANALNASPTLQALTGESENPYRDKITDVEGKVFTIKGLLEDLEIKITLGTADNPNFDGIGISPFDDTRWTMLAIEFNYEKDIKNNVKLEATITITQYLYVGLASSANKSTGDFKAEVTPYSQTDIDFKILVCTMSKDGEDDKDKDKDKKVEKKDISIEIEKLASGEGDSSNIIKDVQEMLENKGDAVELCKAPLFTASFTIGGVIQINIDLNFVIKVSFAAGVKINATLLEATTIGVTGNYKTKTVDCYRRSAMGSDRYIFDFYAYGYLGLKAGIKGELTVSFLGLKYVLRAGVAIEVGAYADLYGYLHYHAEERRVFKDVETNGRHFQTLEGGLYFESGIYIELSAFIGVGKKEYGISKEFKFKLLDAGDKYLYIEGCDNEDIVIIFNENEDNQISIEDLIPAEGKYMDITNGEIETRFIPSKNIKLISGTNLFKVDNKNHLLIANMDKIENRLNYGIPYGTISLYYKGPNILFSSSYLNENIPELKGYKELCKVTVVYLPEGQELDNVSDFGKEITITYKVKNGDKEETVKTENIIAGQYYRGDIPLEIISYCKKNGLLTEIDGTTVTYDGYTNGKHILNQDTTFVFTTVEAQRFIAVKYKSKADFASSNDTWTVDIMAYNYNELPTLLDNQKYTPLNVYYEYFVITPNGNRHVMGNEYLSKYDLYMRGTHGYKTGEVLHTINGTTSEINAIFEEMNSGTGTLKEYSEFFTFTLEAEYITGMQTVYFFDQRGTYASENVKYGETFRVPDYWIRNINQSTSQRLAGWDIDGDKKIDILPNQQFTVTKDMVLYPIMTALGYTITIIDADGNENVYPVDAGSQIPSNILDIINTDPESKVSSDKKSFYTENYWRITTSDFVTGNNGYAYFRGVTMKYYGDITIMPSCDIIINEVKGELYHYVTFVDNTDGYYTYINDEGDTIEAKEVTFVVKDGTALSTSSDYNKKELKYHAPRNVSFYQSTYKTEKGEVLDIFNTKINEGNTYYHSLWARYDGTYKIVFEYFLYFNGEFTKEQRHLVTGALDESQANEILNSYDAEYDYLTSNEYYNSLENNEFMYKTFANNANIKRSVLVDGYGITNVYYSVYITKQYKEYIVTVNYEASDFVDFTTKVHYKDLFFVDVQMSKAIIGEDEYGKYIGYYKLLGFDTNGDGIIDLNPGEIIEITENLTLTAVWETEPSNKNRIIEN